MKKRVDVLLVERGLAESRAQAQALVMAGLVPGTRVTTARCTGLVEKQEARAPGEEEKVATLPFQADARASTGEKTFTYRVSYGR